MAGIAPARRAALHMLWQVLAENRMLTEIDLESALSPADRARARRLAVETLRALSRIDHLLKAHLRKNPPAHIKAILRLGTYELCTGGDAHGVVNDCVALAAANRKSAHLKGLVNAILRKIAATGPAAWDKAPVPRLPDWLRGPLVEAYGKATIQQIEQVQAQTPPVDLTLKAKGTFPDGTPLPTGSLRLHDAGQISALPGFEAGDWWVQDAAAAIPAQVLAAQSGEAVLDMCAAPGGKTMQISASGAQVTALDISEHRLKRVIENLARTNLAARIVAEDAVTHEGTYDAILLDAPCSATGTLRRHPDLPYAKDGSEFFDLFRLQANMIDRAVSLLKPGGRLVFCTCSLLPDEGEVQAEEALQRHADLQPDPDALNRPGIDPDWRAGPCGLRLRPDHWADQGGIDGFFIAAFTKTAP